jgi:hypothetical protein
MKKCLYQVKVKKYGRAKLKGLAESARAGWQAAARALDHHAAAVGARCRAAREVAALNERREKAPNE